MNEKDPGYVDPSRISKIANYFIGFGQRAFRRPNSGNEVLVNTARLAGYDLYGPVPHDPRLGVDTRSIEYRIEEAKVIERDRLELIN
ncbi:MAG TPA: hypothetical protein VIH90_05170 [Candidatus Saccharimonadales bacterium]